MLKNGKVVQGNQSYKEIKLHSAKKAYPTCGYRSALCTKGVRKKDYVRKRDLTDDRTQPYFNNCSKMEDSG